MPRWQILYRSLRALPAWQRPLTWSSDAYTELDLFVKYLIEEGALLLCKTCEVHDLAGYTALHLCVLYDRPILLVRIIQSCPELLFIDTPVHPLHLAILNGRNECLVAMLDECSKAWQRLSP